MLKEILDAIVRVFFGHNAVDNAIDWKQAHDKSTASRAEVERIIQESEANEKDNKKGKRK